MCVPSQIHMHTHTHAHAQKHTNKPHSGLDLSVFLLDVYYHGYI